VHRRHFNISIPGASGSVGSYSCFTFLLFFSKELLAKAERPIILLFIYALFCDLCCL